VRHREASTSDVGLHLGDLRRVREAAEIQLLKRGMLRTSCSSSSELESAMAARSRSIVCLGKHDQAGCGASCFATSNTALVSCAEDAARRVLRRFVSR
jgi:hypothetical protein